MLRANYVCLYVLLCFLTGCQNNAKEVSNETSKKEDKVVKDSMSNDVIWAAKPSNFAKIEYFQVFNYDLFYGINPNEKISNYTGLRKENSKLIIPNISEPQVIEIRSGIKLNGEIKVFNTRVYASPGDSLNFTINEGNIKFIGKNAANYNFFSELDLGDLAWSRVGYQNDLMNYKSRAKKLYDSRKAFLEKYIQKNPEVSKEFIEEVGEELYFEYVYNLLAPRSEWNPVNRLYVNTMQGLIFIIEKNESSAEVPFNLEAYLDDVQFKDFDQPDLVGNDYYQRSLEESIRSYFSENRSADYTIENFNKELQYIQANVDDPLATTLQGKLIRRYYFNGGFGRGSMERKFLQEQISVLKEKELTASQKEAIEEIENKLESSNPLIPSSFLEEKVVSFTTSDTLILKALIEDERYSILYFDRFLPKEDIDMQQGNSIRKGLEKLQEVQFIYINLNNSHSTWVQRAKLYEEELGVQHQYRLFDVKNSKLLRFLKVKINDDFYFPVLSLVDKNGTILRNDLPLPSTGIPFQKSVEDVWE